jgi:hypothetical protein
MQPHTGSDPYTLSLPFDPLFAKVQAEFPLAFQYQFLHSVDTESVVLLEGTMDKVWHRPVWLWPLFWLLAQVDILFPETGMQIPASMQVIGGRDEQHQPYQKWDRVFSFNRLRYFNAIMAYDQRRQCVVEWLGPWNVIQVAWDIRFQPPTTIRIVTKGCRLIIGGIQLPLLRWFYPQVKATETVVANDLIHIDLEVSHPLLGVIFGYDGYFQIRIVTNDE